jgi:hypothetical protein
MSLRDCDMHHSGLALLISVTGLQAFSTEHTYSVVRLASHPCLAKRGTVAAVRYVDGLQVP